MTDRKISATVVAAWALWVIGAALMAVGLYDLRFMGIGLWFTAIAAVCTIRQMLCHWDAELRNAFELGRDRERDVASVRSIR